MSNSTNVLATCPTCGIRANLGNICGAGLPDVCGYCADRFILEREYMHATEQDGPTSIEARIEELREELAVAAFAAEARGDEAELAIATAELAALGGRR